MCRFNGLFNGKSSSVSNLIFVKSLPYLHSPSFMTSISFLNPSQSYLYFFNTSLFSYVGCSSDELKTKYLFPLFSLVCSIYQSLDTKDLHYEYIFLIIKFFNCNVSSVVNTNIFVRLFVYF